METISEFKITNLERFDQLLDEGKKAKNKIQKSELKEKLFEFYDTLPGITAQEMFGDWKGGAWKVGVPLDGLLELGQWHGKTFHNTNRVDAVIHKFKFFSIIGFIGSILYFPWKIWGEKQKYRMPGTKACLREVIYRGKASTSMIYYYLPIIDHFRKVDQNTLMGIMDMKGKTKHEFIFFLKRDS